VIGRFDPGFPAHDLSFTADGRRVWVTSASGPDVSVFSARDHRLLFRVPVGPPPQHVAFDGPYAYVTSGYGDMIEKVAQSNGRLVERATSPHGSFELDAADGFVATSSLLLGELAIYNSELRLLHVLHLAPATRDVAISAPWPRADRATQPANLYPTPGSVRMNRGPSPGSILRRRLAMCARRTWVSSP
jgi:hypothetical protein